MFLVDSTQGRIINGNPRHGNQGFSGSKNQITTLVTMTTNQVAKEQQIELKEPKCSETYKNKSCHRIEQLNCMRPSKAI